MAGINEVIDILLLHRAASEGSMCMISGRSKTRLEHNSILWLFGISQCHFHEPRPEEGMISRFSR